MSARYTYEIVQGECLPVVIRITDDVSGLPINLNGSTAEIAAQWLTGVYTDNTSGGVTVDSDGYIRGELPSTETDKMPAWTKSKLQIWLTLQGDTCRQCVMNAELRVSKKAAQ
jgi:hypothetical protein